MKSPTLYTTVPLSPSVVIHSFIWSSSLTLPLTLGEPLLRHGGRWSNHTAQIFLTWPSVSSCVRHGCNPLERFPGFVICGPRYAAILGWLFSAVQASAAQY